MANLTMDSITIRSELKPGDLSYVSYKQAKLYSDEYNFGVDFEQYVLAGMSEFAKSYDPEKDRVWICEHNHIIIGFLLLMHRENNSSQLRYFYLDKEYRGIGLGKKLMTLYLEFYKEKRYKSSYLWTTKNLDSAAVLYTKFGFKLTEEKETNAFGIALQEQRYEI